MEKHNNIEYAILDHTTQGKCIIDSEYVVHFWNKRLSQITEVKKEIIEGKKITDLFHKFEEPRYKLRIDNGFQNSAPIIFSSVLHHELFTIDENKGKYFFKIMITFFKNNQDKKLAMISLEDVTELHLRINEYNDAKKELRDALYEQKLIGKELQTSQKMYSELAENVPGVIYSWYENSDGSRGFKYISPKIKEIFGFEVEDILNDYGNLSLHPDDLKGFLDSIDNAKTHISDWNYEGRFLLENGNTRWWFAQAKLITYQNGNFIFNGVLYDITQRKKTEISLEKSEKRFKDLAHAAGEYIWEVDIHGNYTFVTDKIERILGYKKDEILGRTPFDYVYFEDKERVSLFFGDIVEKQKAFKNLEHRSKTKDSRLIWQRVNGVPIFENGNLIGFRGTALDITEEKSMTNKLEINEERLSLSLISSGQGLWDWDISTNEAYFNEHWSILMGYGKKEFKKDVSFWFSTIHPEDLRYLKDKIYKRLFTGEDQFLDSNIRAFNNNEEWIWLNVRGKVVSWNNDGKPERVLGIIQNITERKLAEEMMLRREQEFKALVENAPDIITRIDKSLRFIYINPAFDKEFGIRNNEILGKMLDETIQFIDDSDYWAENILNIFVGKQRTELSSCVRYNDEYKYFNTQIVPEFNNEGSVNTLLTITRNVTEIRKAQDEILKINEYNDVLNDVSTSLVNAPISNIDNYINYAIKIIGQKSNSDNICIYQFSADRILLINNYEWNAISTNQLQDNYQGILIEELPWWLKLSSEREIIKYNNYSKIPDYAELEKEIINETGFKSFVILPMIVSEQLYGFILLGSKNENTYDNNNLELFLKMASEIITGNLARKDFDNELLQAKNEAIAANKAKSVFLANISHEIRTPMNAVIGFAEILKDQLKIPKQLEYTQGILSSGKSLLNLINDILDLSKIESGKMDIQLDFVNIENIVDDIKLMFSLKAKEKNLDFYFSIDDNLNTTYLMDELRLKQILINLLGNALKFTHNGFVSMQVLSEKKSDMKYNLIFKVKDSGIGIPKEEQTKIFEPFRQQDEQNTKLYGGTGLGLTITQRLVELMEGEVELKSKVGIGSEFTITIPNVEAVENNHKSEKELKYEHVIFEHKNVLIADDNELNQKVFSEFLKDFDFNITTVNNGKELLDEIDKSKPDLIIFDLQLPIINGIDAAKQIRNDNTNNDIILIAVSAYSSNEKTEEINKYTDALIAKPVNKNDLLNHLINLIPHKLIIEDNDMSENVSNKVSINFNKQFNSDVVDILKNDLIKKWESVKTNHIISEIGEFAENIRDNGKEFDEEELVKYGEAMQKYVQSFNIEKMMNLLDNFELFVKKNVH